ncbi:MAG: aldose 1-epimerase family protein [Clostridia bacterium]|nr:aldose 1-epimerase family protein [Clostridia bacterium]
MPYINGQFFSRQDLLRRTGNIRQLAGVRSSEILLGKSGGIKIFDVTSNQLRFTSMESRNLDLIDLSYKGMPINFLSKAGPVCNAIADPVGINFLRSVTGGMIYTCGFSNVGAQYEDENGVDYFHGRQRFLPAENISIIEKWEGDDYIVGVGGEMRDNGLFRENLVLRRRITTKLGTKTVNVEDEIENESFQEAPFMIMYHVNVGFPILQQGTKVFIPSKKVIPMGDFSKKELENWGTVIDPVDGMPETVFVHEIQADADGYSYAGEYNEKLGLGVCVRTRAENLPYMVEWRSMGSSDYVLGIQPANCHASGRKYEMENGEVQHIKPFEKKQAGLQLTILDGKEDYEQFLAKFKGCKI